MAASLRSVHLHDRAKPLKIVRSELTDKTMSYQRRDSRHLTSDLKLMDRAQKVLENDIKRERKKYENSLQSLASARRRSSIYDSHRKKTDDEHKSIFRQRPGDTGYVDECRVRWGTGAVDVPSSPSLDCWAQPSPRPQMLSKRALGKCATKSSHRYSTGIGTGSKRATSIEIESVESMKMMYGEWVGGPKSLSKLGAGARRMTEGKKTLIDPADLKALGAGGRRMTEGKEALIDPADLKALGAGGRRMTEGKETLIDSADLKDLKVVPSKKPLWTPKNEHLNQVRKKLVDQLEFDRRMRGRHIPPEQYRVTDIVVL